VTTPPPRTIHNVTVATNRTLHTLSAWIDAANILYMLQEKIARVAHRAGVAL
jgi:hypothetical protein